jgi:cyclopropane fatty-acyl-phospholipid synthase-like methyltransferase
MSNYGKGFIKVEYVVREYKEELTTLTFSVSTLRQAAKELENRGYSLNDVVECRINGEKQ